MSEGPQVRLRSEMLGRWLAGRRIVRAHTSRAELEAPVSDLSGRAVLECFCRGKHLFLKFEGGLYLHNHLLMRGRWRRLDGELLFLPPGFWLGLSTGAHTVCNINGQMLRPADAEGVAKVISSLGPDTMDSPFPAREVCRALRDTQLPIAEALLDQSIVCGVGNVARSECMYLAGIDPRTAGAALSDSQVKRLAGSIEQVMQDSYRSGGRWVHRVYRRSKQPCTACGMRIRLMRLKPSMRSVYLCPRCQR